MKRQKISKKSEDEYSLLKRCTSSYKHEFLSNDKLKFKKDTNLSSNRNKEKSSIIVNNNFENLFSLTNLDTNEFSSCKNLIETHNTDCDKRNENNLKIKNFLEIPSIKRTFSPQILHSKIEYNLNLNKRKKLLNTRNSQIYIKQNYSNLINYHNEKYNKNNHLNYYRKKSNKNLSELENLKRFKSIFYLINLKKFTIQIFSIKTIK